MIKKLLILLLFFGFSFGQDLTFTIINGMKDKIEYSDELINTLKNKHSNKLNGNVVYKDEDLSYDFTLVNGLVSGTFNYSHYYPCEHLEKETICHRELKVDYLNGLKNGRFFYRVEIPEIPNYLRLDCVFKNNSLNGPVRNFVLGSISDTHNFKNDILDGPQIFYFMNKEKNGFLEQIQLKSILKNGEIISQTEYNRRGRVISRSGESRDKHTKQLKDFQKSLDYFLEN